MDRFADTLGPLRLFLLAMMVGAELVALASGLSPFAYLSQAAFVALCLIAWPWMTIRERTLLGVSVLLTAVLIGHDDSARIFGSALQLAVFFGTFILLISTIKEAAARSPAILKVGHYLTSQPAGRRFYATATGGHLLGVFLNFAAVSLMSPLIQKSAVHPDGSHDPDLERRQLSALIRGFSWILLWAPTTLSQAVLLTIFTDVAWGDFVWLGIASAIVMTVIGRFYDRFEWPALSRTSPAQSLAFPTRDAVVVLGVCAILIGATFAGQAVFGASIATALMFVAPTVTIIWFMAQTHTDRVAPVLRDAAPALARSALALGLSGYIGRVAANLLPVDQIAAVIPFATLPGWLFLSILPVLITLGGQVALSPILLVVFLGEVLNIVPDLPVEDVHILFALSAGWALSMTASPNATATLLISAVTNVPPTTLTWKWNLKYGLICYAAFVAIFITIA